MPRASPGTEGATAASPTVRLAAALLGGLAVLFSPAGAAAQTLPPVTVGGQLSHSVSWRDGRTGETLQNISLATLDLRSYIWQPWFVTVGTRFDVGYEFQSGETGSDGRLLAGSLELGILPLSPIPTFFSWRHVDDRTDFEEFDSRTVGDFFTLTNRLRLPAGWTTSTVGTFSHVDQFDETQTSRSLALSANKTFETQTLGINLRHSHSATADDDAGDERDELNSVVVNHQFRPRSHLNFNSSVSLIARDDETPRRDEEELQLQAFTIGRWRPPEKSYSLTGTLRARAEQEDETGDRATGTQREYELSGSLGANWRPVERLSLNAGVNALGEVDEAGGSRENRLRAGGSLGASYSSVQHRFAGFAWSWNTNGSLSGNAGTDGGQGTASAGFGHRIGRGFDIGIGAPVVFGLSQSVSGTVATDGDARLRLSHGLRLSHNRSSERGRFGISLSLTDSRSIGERDTFQLGSFALNSAWAFTRDTRLDGTLSLQLARREDEDGSRVDSSASGTLALRHRDLFDIRNLFFESRLRLQASGFPVSDEEGRRDRRTARWSNRLDYRIGKLTVRLEGRLTRIEEDLTKFVILRVIRAL